MRRIFPILLNQGGAVLWGLGSVKLLSKMVSPAVYGLYALFITLIQLGPMLTHSALSNHAARYWQREREHAGLYVSFLWRQSWLSALSLVPLIVLICATLSYLKSDTLWLWLVPALFIGNLSSGINAVALALLNASESFWKQFVLGTVGGISRLVFPVILVVLFSPSLQSLAWGLGLQSLVVLGWVAFSLRAKGTDVSENAETKGGEQWRKELREYGRPFVIMGMAAWALANADRWIVANFFGADRAGVFAMATGMAAVIPTLAMGGLMQLSFPAVFRQADEAKTPRDWFILSKRCDQITFVFLILALAGLLLLWFLRAYMVGWLLSPRFSSALEILLPAGFGAAAPMVNQFHFLILQGQHNSKGMVKVMVVTAGVKTVCSIGFASVSWNAFLWWLVLSPVLTSFVGRFLIHRLARIERKPGLKVHPLDIKAIKNG